MGDLLLRSPARMCPIALHLPLSHVIACVDDRKIVSGYIFVIRNGLRWRDASKESRQDALSPAPPDREHVAKLKD